jgi:hypothetical protein
VTSFRPARSIRSAIVLPIPVTDHGIYNVCFHCACNSRRRTRSPSEGRRSPHGSKWET